uniref:Pyrin domain-containing protein 3-like n=1 Tax=Callorhinus ursinus TaxID=34884 RepID=A0A3Q7PYA0_CALUR|nr:pyrin domain-containing protein 3-like [Callorhinus ursinus]
MKKYGLNRLQMQNGNQGYYFIEGRVMLMSPQRMDGPVPGSPRGGSSQGPIRTAPYPVRRRTRNPDHDELPIQAMAHLNLGGRRRRRQTFATVLPTWGQIKRLGGEGQKILQRTGKACTPENLFLAMCALLTVSSSAEATDDTTAEQLE